jgi:glycosyltransferase involved in cell wall biosynthesis
LRLSITAAISRFSACEAFRGSTAAVSTQLIYIVDDGCTDGTREAIEDNFPCVKDRTGHR